MHKSFCNNPDNTPKAIHLMTGSSTVACGATMRMPGRDGWDLGTATTEPMAVTCSNCLPDYSGMPDRRGAPRYVRPAGKVDR